MRGAGADPILVIGTTGDPATPYQWSVLLASSWRAACSSARGRGTAYGKGSCVSTLVDAYFLRGDVPASDPMCTEVIDVAFASCAERVIMLVFVREITSRHATLAQG